MVNRIQAELVENIAAFTDKVWQINPENWIIAGSSAMFMDVFHRIPRDLDIFVKCEKDFARMKEIFPSELAGENRIAFPMGSMDVEISLHPVKVNYLTLQGEA